MAQVFRLEAAAVCSACRLRWSVAIAVKTCLFHKFSFFTLDRFEPRAKLPGFLFPGGTGCLTDCFATIFGSRRRLIFGGLSIEETAEVLAVSPGTVMRDWTLAKAWLRRAISS